jgi:hypothetical protein
MAMSSSGRKISDNPKMAKIKHQGYLYTATAGLLSTRISFYLKLDKEYLSYGRKCDAQIRALAPKFAVFSPYLRKISYLSIRLLTYYMIDHGVRIHHPSNF